MAKDKSGRLFWTEVNLKRVKIENRGRLLSIVRDITERKQAEKAQREILQRLEFALQGGNLGMWDWNPQDGAVVYSNLWAQMLEYRPNEVEPTVEFFKQHVHPEDLSAVLDRLTGHVEGRLPAYESEHRIRTKSGRWLWVLDRGKIAERDKDGRPARVTGLIADITERKEAEEALRESEERFRLIAENTSDSIWIMDTALQFTYLSISKTFRIKPGANAKIAVMNVGKTVEYIKANSPDSRLLSVVHEPNKDNPSHCGIFGLVFDDHLIADLIAETVKETHPTGIIHK